MFHGFALPSALTLLLAAAAAATPQDMTQPETEKKPVTDEFHGEKVTEPYRWLENGDDAAVKAWITKENAYAESVLSRTPNLAAIQARVRALESSSSSSWKSLKHTKAGLFAIKSQPPKQQPFVVMLESADKLKTEKVVVDPNKLDPKGHLAIDFYAPTRDGKLVAVSLSKDGTESGDVRVFETATGKERTKEIVPRVNGGTAGGSMAWKADGSGFWYTRYPRGTERAPEDMGFFQQVYFHALGTTTDKDVYALGKDFPRIAEVELETSESGDYVLATVANGDGGEFEHWIAGKDGKWTRLAALADRISHAQFGKDCLYLISLKGTPRGTLLKLPLTETSLAKATVLLPEGEGAISHFEATDTRLLVVTLQGGPSDLTSYDLDGKNPVRVGILPVSYVGQVVHTKGDELLYRNESFVEPSSWYRTKADGVPSKTALVTTSPADYSDTEVVREFAVSKDGTKIPINILKKKGTERNGKNPTVLYAYGGYGISLTPAFSSFQRVWIEQGGVWAIANLRGGGEYGDAWHLAGNLTKKQNVFDDYAACADYLSGSGGWTSPAMLAAYGRSNGGLLMGAALTQHPEQFKAVVAVVGVFDMLRVELHSNGAFNVTEYGTVKDAAQYKALRAYSPYHNVKDGTAYPASLFITGSNDPRVDPFQSRKMAARLQASGSKAPVVLRTTAGGHGGGGSGSLEQRIEQESDIYSFLFGQLGLTYQAVPAKAQPTPAAKGKTSG